MRKLNTDLEVNPLANLNMINANQIMNENIFIVLQIYQSSTADKAIADLTV
ncbi:MAG: hypothetical protein K5874_04200 [Bacteroidaceae bacterium]|nr:hypothetical protein [Bacteroidaceae bacterium]